MTTIDPVFANEAASAGRHADRGVRFYNVRLSAQEAWLGATVAALFNALGMLLEMAIIQRIPGISTNTPVVSGIVAVILLAVLFVRRKRPSVRWASAIYLVNTASVVTVLLFTNLQFAVAESERDQLCAGPTRERNRVAVEAVISRGLRRLSGLSGSKENFGRNETAARRPKRGDRNSETRKAERGERLTAAGRY